MQKEIFSSTDNGFILWGLGGRYGKNKHLSLCKKEIVLNISFNLTKQANSAIRKGNSVSSSFHGITPLISVSPQLLYRKT